MFRITKSEALICKKFLTQDKKPSFKINKLRTI